MTPIFVIIKSFYSSEDRELVEAWRSEKDAEDRLEELSASEDENTFHTIETIMLKGW